MPSYLDLGVIAIILVSALLAMMRGFTREVLAIASWIAATVAGYYLYPQVLPYIRPYVTKQPFDAVASFSIVFVVALIVVSIVTVNLSDAILDSRIGAVDRSLGFLFGAARGFFLCVIAFVFFTKLAPEKQPNWVVNARMRPLLQSVGTDLEAMLPNDLLSKYIKTKPAPAEEPPPENDIDKTAPEENSPAPLPPPRNGGGQ